MKFKKIEIENKNILQSRIFNCMHVLMFNSLSQLYGYLLFLLISVSPLFHFAYHVIATNQSYVGGLL